MNTLDRYLLREILVPFAAGLGLFFAVVAFIQVLKVSDSVTGLGITGTEVAQALLYSLPPLLGLLIPVSGLFATLLGVGRLASDRELIAAAASGISPYRWLRVPCAWGLVLAVASGTAMAVGEPWGIRGLRDLMARSAQRALAGGVRLGEFNEWVPNVTFSATGRQGDAFTNVVFADQRDPGQPLIVSAKFGHIYPGEQPRDILFHMRDGTMLINNRKTGTERVIHFGTSTYRLDVGQLVGQKAMRINHVQEKSMSALWRDMHDPAQDSALRASFTVILHRRMALPLAALVFCALAVPLAFRATGGARARGFLLSGGIVGTYYYVGRAAEVAARAGEFNAALAAWLPDLLGAVLFGGLLIRWRRRGA